MVKLKIADYVTFMNSIFGIISIYFSIAGQIKISLACLVAAAVFDSLDGEIARFMKSENKFGMELDSLSDTISFVVAPAVLGASLYQNYYILISSIFFVVCGVFRLARFNVESVPYFKGVPTTTNGILLPLLYPFFSEKMFLFYYVIMGILMASSIKIKKLKLF